MTTSTPNKPRLSLEEAEDVLAGVLLTCARFFASLARKVGGSQVAAEADQINQPEREYGYYTAASLEESVRKFESHFGLPASEFYALYQRNSIPDSIPRHAANVWAGLADELSRLQRQAQSPDDLFKAAVAS